MNRLAARILSMTLAASAALAQSQPASQPAWRELIHPGTLDGWTQRGGKASYRAEGGEIVGTTVPKTPNSFLCTNDQFADFEIEYEFKVDSKLNSGVQIRSNSFAGYKDGVVHGYQVEIDPSERAFTAGIYDESRRGWLADLSKNEPARKAFRQNEWNRVRVEARGERIRTWLNDVPAADLTDGLTRRGFVALQVHSTESETPLEVRWRNIRVRDRGDPTLTPPSGAIVLLGATGDLSAWQHADGKPIAWKWADGALEVAPGSGDILTRRPFGDCLLHVEFAVDDNGKEGQANGNSGVYVQQRYEVQVLNSAGQKPTDDNCGAIYKVKAADFNCALPAGQWQTYDIEFRQPRWSEDGAKREPARMTVLHNGTRIHENVAIPDKTGGGQTEGATPGPLLLQDHGNRIRYRNLWLLER